MEVGGASSGRATGGGFAIGLPKNGTGKSTERLHPATFNTQGRFVTPEKTIKKFEKMYGGANVEYAISVDSMGFVHRHRTDGGKNSVRINAGGKNHTVVHNHPSGSAFSGADLKAFAREKNIKTLIATGRVSKGKGKKGTKRQRYTITKTHKFDSKGFNKALKKAKWPKNYDYNKGVRWWLSKNAAKFGYKFEFKS